MGEEVSELAQPVGAAVLIDGNVIDIGERELRLPQAISDGLRGKTRPMLDAAEALLLGGGEKHAVAHECGGGIAVERVESEDDHKPCSEKRTLMHRRGRRIRAQQ